MYNELTRNSKLYSSTRILFVALIRPSSESSGTMATVASLTTSLKQFAGLHLFELAYLCLLAVLPFLVAKPVVGITILAILVVLAFSSIWRMLTFRRVPHLQNKSVLITGCDTGFGHALAKRMSSVGMTVFAGCLDPDRNGVELLKTAANAENIHIIPLDVTSEDSVTKAVDIVKEKTKETGLWCLVNNAGVSCVVDVEFCSMDMYRTVTDVNLFGMVRVTKGILPLVRAGKGRVVNVTSADVCYPYHSAHAMSKAGCSAFSTSLRREMSKFGVAVITVEPGNFYGATGLLNKSTLNSQEKLHATVWSEASPEVRDLYGEDYLPSELQTLATFAGTSCNSLGPVVDAMEDAIVSTKPSSRYLVDGSSLLFDIHNVLLKLNWLLPQRWVDYFIERELCSGTKPTTNTKKIR